MGQMNRRKRDRVKAVAVAPVVVPPPEPGAYDVHRGAFLPLGVTAPAGGSLLADPTGTPYNVEALTVGGARYNAAQEITIATTGEQGRTDVNAAITTAAADGDHDYRIIAPVGVLSGGVFLLKAKANRTRHCWLVTAPVHAGTFAKARGTRLARTDAAGMTTLESSTSLTQDGVIEVEDSGAVRGYSFHGIQVRAGANIQLGMVCVRRASGSIPDTLDDCPGEMWFDRVIMDGQANVVRRGVLANGPLMGISDSLILNVHTVGNESAGWAGWSGSKRQFHINSELQGGTQFVLYGGADPDKPNMGIFDPSDILTDRCLGVTPWSWRGVWTRKTGFEAKNCSRWVNNRSVSKNSWADAQAGHMMLFQNLSDNNTNELENRVNDIVVRHHWMDRVRHGLNLLSRVAYNGGPMPVNPMSRHVYENILMTRVGGADDWNASSDGNGRNGDTFQILGDIRGLIIDHYTTDGQRWGLSDGTGGTGFVITNGVSRVVDGGVLRDGGPYDLAALQAHATDLQFGGFVGWGGGAFPNGTAGLPAVSGQTLEQMAFQNAAAYDYRLTTQHLTAGVGGARPGYDYTQHADLEAIGTES